MTSISRCLVTCFTLLLFLVPFCSLAQQKLPTDSQKVAWEQFLTENDNNWKLRWSTKTGTPASLYGSKSKSYEGDPETKAKLFLKENLELFDFSESYVDQLVLAKIVDKKNGTFVRLKQTYNSIRIFGGEYVIRFDNEDRVTYSGGYLYNKLDLNTSPKLSESEAIHAAKKSLDITETRSEPYAELVILPKDGNYYLTWRVVLDEALLKKWECFIDDANGKYILHNSLISFANGQGNAYVTHPGEGGYSTVTLPGLEFDLGQGGYVLENGFVKPLKNGQTIVDLQGNFYFNPPHYSIYDNTNFDMVNVFYHISTYADDYIIDELGFTPPGPIYASVHDNLDLAGFDADGGTWGELIFGQVLTGDYYDHAKSNEEIYHEYNHAVFYEMIGLSKVGEAGAMNEGYADYFACSYTDDPYWAEWLVKNHPSDFRRLNTDPVEFNYANYNTVAYPETGHPAGDIHTNGMIWSGALWDLRTALGQTLADEIIFGSFIYLTSSPAFLDGLDGIIAYDNSEHNGQHTNIIKNVFCTRGITFPETPKNLTISGNPGTFPNLSWSANSECNLAGYRIYRLFFNKPYYDLIATVDASVTTYEDRELIIGNNPLDPWASYKISAIDDLGQESALSNIVSTKVGGLNKESQLYPTEYISATEYVLRDAYPNPFNPLTQVEYVLPAKFHVLINVYDILGKEISTLENTVLEKGVYKTTFNAEELPAGIYIVQFYAKNLKTNILNTEVQKVVLLK